MVKIHPACSPDCFNDLDSATHCQRGGSTLLDIQIDPNEIPPMIVRMRALTNKLQKGTTMNRLKDKTALISGGSHEEIVVDGSISLACLP